MEMKKLGHKKESDPQRRIEKFDKFAQKFNQNTCREFFLIILTKKRWNL